MAITLEELQIKFSAETGALKSRLSDVQNQLGGLEKSADKAQNSLGFLKKAGAALGGAMIGRKLINIGKDALMMANDVVESEELFEVSMGRMAARAREWSDTIGESLGLNPYDLRKNVGMLNVMFDSMGLGEEEAYEMSTSLTQLANDMASFYNMDTEEAFTKLRAGITGETEPLKRLGILVDENTIKQYAMANGISKTGKEMTQTQKLQARYGAIMQQTMKAQGDLARTMDSPTNQLRILNNQFDQAKIALGQALQPALIAVLPHVTNFATGLARLMRGELSGNPLSGSLLSLAGATEAIRSRIDISIIGITEEVARLQEGTEAAIDGYIQAASETRELYLNINMKPQNTVYTRINNIFEKLDEQINTASTQNLKGEVKKRLDIILQDGIVTGPERQSIIAYMKEQRAKLREEAEDRLKKIQADAEYQLNVGEIDMDTHDQMLIDAQTAYDATIGTLDSLIAEAMAEVDIIDWTASTISAADRTKMANAINKEIAAGEALLVSANAQVQALFEGSSLEEAVLGMYGDLTTEINKKNGEINELLTAWLKEDDGTALEKAMAKHEENKKLLAIATGGLTSEGKINKALMAIGDATPEEISNFAKGYAETLKEMTAGYIERGEERENVLYNMPDSYIAKQGKTRKQMLAENTAETNAAIAGASGAIMDAVMEGLAPQINKIFDDTANADIFDVAILRKAVDELAQSIDDAGQDATGLWDLEHRLERLADWLDFSARDLDTRNKGMPDWWLDGPQLPLTQYYDPMAHENKGYKAPPKLTQYYDPMAHEGKGYKDLVFSGADITISNPRMKYQSLIDGFAVGGGGSFDVNVGIEPQDIVVNLYLDETQLGRANIRATQTVTKSTGSGRNLMSVPMQVLN
jgi:hypothetical protein